MTREEELQRIMAEVDGSAGGSVSAGQAAMPSYLSSQAEGASAVGDIFNVDTPGVDQFGAEQQAKASQFQSQYPEGLFKTDNKLGWWQEKATLNSMNQIVPMLGYAAGAVLQAVPNPVAKVLGKTITGATFASQYNANLADTLQEHRDRAGRELSQQEKVWAAVIAGGVAALDRIAPGKVGKDVAKSMGGMGAVDTARKSIIKRMNASRQSLLSSIGTGAKYVGGVTGREALTESAQKALQIGTSVDPGYLTTRPGMESIVEEGVIAGPTSGLMSTPQGIVEATSQNRDIGTARRDAKRWNTTRSSEAGHKYMQTGVSEDIDKIEITKAEDILSKGGRAIDALSGDRIGRGLKAFADIGAYKPASIIKEARDRQTTGKNYAIMNDVLQSFIEPGSQSGEVKVRDSFHQRKDLYSGQLLGEVTAVLDQLSKHPKFGLMGRELSGSVNDFIRLTLTKPNSPETLAIREKLIKDEGFTQKMMSQVTHAAALMREKQDEAFTLMKEAGIPVKYQENYIYNPVSEKAVRDNRKGFIESLVAASVKANKENSKIKILTDEQAAEIADSISHGKDPSVLTSKYLIDKNKKKGTKKKGKQDFEKSRSDIWKHLDDEFREKDLGKVMEQYLLRAATRVASAETFGAKGADRLQKNLDTLKKEGDITQSEVGRVWDMYDAVHNTYKKDVKEGEQLWRDASRFGTTVGAITHLGLATLSSLPELIWVGERAGFGNMMKTLPSAFNYAFKGAKHGLGGKKGEQSEGAKQLARLGFNLNPEVNDRLDQLFSADRSKILSGYFRSPFGAFLTQWTNFTRNWAAQTGLSMMNEHANSWNTIPPAKKSKFLRELKEQGITASDFEQIIEASRDSSGKINISILNDDFLDKTITKEYKTMGKKGTQTRVRDIMIPWVHKIVSDVVVQPNATNKPLWMSNPSWSMLAQLKTFPIVFGNTVVKRLLRKLNPRSCSADFGLALSVMGAIAGAYAVAFIGETMKSGIRGKDMEDFTLMSGAHKIGLTAVPGMLVGAGKYGSGAESLAGVHAGAVGTLFEDVVYPIFGEGEIGDGTGNLIDWILESGLQGLGPAGIAIKGSFEE